MSVSGKIDIDMKQGEVKRSYQIDKLQLTLGACCRVSVAASPAHRHRAHGPPVGVPTRLSVGNPLACISIDRFIYSVEYNHIILGI